VQLKSDVGFGRKDFSLDQTRTSRQLEQAQRLDPQADYCGVWYIHRTPNRELTDEEWRQTQATLEDPDFHFPDLVCLVLSYYNAELNMHASYFTRAQAARGQAPVPTELRLTTDWGPTRRPETSSAAKTPPKDWYKQPETADRLARERQRLDSRYDVEPAMAPDGQMYFRLSPKYQYEKMAFYLAIGYGFPETAPHVFLLVGGKPYRISSPLLGSWNSSRWLVEVADELVQWLAFSIDEYFARAQTEYEQGHYAEAADLLRLVLSIDPRTPQAARTLARIETRL
jgi:hypothetical protein